MSVQNDTLELNENVAQLQRDNSLHNDTLKVRLTFLYHTTVSTSNKLYKLYNGIFNF